MNWGSSVTYIGETRVKGKDIRFGIKDADRLATLSVIGRAGSGRAQFLTNMVLQDVSRGIGAVVLDGTGNLTQVLLECFPADARERLVVLDPSDGEHPFSWNPLDAFRTLPPEEALERLSEALASVYQVENGPIVRVAASYMLSHPATTLLLLYEVVADPKTRDKLIPAKSPERQEFESLLSASPETVSGIGENGRYLAKDTLMRNLLSQKTSKVSLDVLKRGGIIVVDFSRIRMFPTRATPLVRLFAEAVHTQASPEAPVSLYMHDCLRYLSEEEVERAIIDRSIAFTVSDTAQGEEESKNREALLHRAGSVAAFLPHEADIPRAERVFYPYVSPEELEKLEPGQMVIVLAIDSVRSRPFFAHALPPIERSGMSHQDLWFSSREKYTTPRLTVDKLFQPKTDEEKDADKKSDDPGSFSDAFRSIFTKRAAGAPAGMGAKPGAAGKPAAAPKAAEPKGSKPAEKSSEKKAASKSQPEKAKPGEIPEDELKKMVYAGRLPA